ILHTEVKTDDSRKPMWSRIVGYNGFLVNLHEIPVYSNVLYLHPKAGRDDKGYYAYKGHGYEYVLRYKVLRLIEIDGQSILEMQAPGLLPFTPLMKPPEGINSNRWLEKCVNVTATARTDQHTRDTLLAALGVFSGLVYEPQLIKQLLPEGIMQESPFFQHYIQEAKTEAKEEGLKEGIEQGIEQGERKGMIESIIALLGVQFKTDAVHALKPALESIDDMQDLKQVLLTVPESDSLEAFMQSLNR
ncbi:MAG: hypothetical protein OXI63_25605, partial [Candidatus Poribacteria bacterium]|nr:hypothetical protein [Candidatus Poribacteria bacterium]